MSRKLVEKFGFCRRCDVFVTEQALAECLQRHPGEVRKAPYEELRQFALYVP